jgi:hypothetical protein
MDFTGSQTSGNNNVASNAPPPTPVTESRAMPSNIPHAPYFQSFPGMGNQVPYVFPHPFMPQSVLGGFAPPPPVNHAVTIDLSEGSQKRPSNEGIAEKSKPNKKKRAPRKKMEVVDLDDTKDDADLSKNTGHWKDHWVIQLVTVRGEMQNTFSAPPKQGKFFFLNEIFLIFFFQLGHV